MFYEACFNQWRVVPAHPMQDLATRFEQGMDTARALALNAINAMQVAQVLLKRVDKARLEAWKDRDMYIYIYIYIYILCIMNMYMYKYVPVYIYIYVCIYVYSHPEVGRIWAIYRASIMIQSKIIIYSSLALYIYIHIRICRGSESKNL